MNKLVSAELDDLPVVIKFLLQTVEPDNVGDVIETIRQKLDFRSINKLQKSSRTKSRKVSINQTPEVLILGKPWSCYKDAVKRCGQILVTPTHEGHIFPCWVQ